jgi:hypothetical protein
MIAERRHNDVSPFTVGRAIHVIGLGFEVPREMVLPLRAVEQIRDAAENVRLVRLSPGSAFNHNSISEAVIEFSSRFRNAAANRAVSFLSV